MMFYALALLAALGACDSPARSQPEVGPEIRSTLPAPTPTRTPPATRGSPIGAPSGAPTTNEVDVSQNTAPVTIKDAEAIKAGLLVRLEQSNVEDRDYLIQMTKSVEPSIEEGVVRIGAWVLQGERERLQLRFRMPSGGALMKGYRADVTHAGDSWSVGPVQLEMIHGRR